MTDDEREQARLRDEYNNQIAKHFEGFKDSILENLGFAEQRQIASERELALQLERVGKRLNQIEVEQANVATTLRNVQAAVNEVHTAQRQYMSQLSMIATIIDELKRK